MGNRDIYFFILNHGWINAFLQNVWIRGGIEHEETVILLRILIGNIDCGLKNSCTRPKL